jgi:hypothetical protein
MNNYTTANTHNYLFRIDEQMPLTRLSVPKLKFGPWVVFNQLDSDLGDITCHSDDDLSDEHKYILSGRKGTFGFKDTLYTLRISPDDSSSLVESGIGYTNQSNCGIIYRIGKFDDVYSYLNQNEDALDEILSGAVLKYTKAMLKYKRAQTLTPSKKHQKPTDLSEYFL